MSIVNAVVDPFKRYFQPEPEEQADDFSDCHEIVEFSKTMYFPKLMAYLERGADEPLKVTGELAIVRSAERINTYKEIRAWLRKQVREAQDILDREQSNG